MKNILNVNKISLKPIFMSLAILFTSITCLPIFLENFTDSSLPPSYYPLPAISPLFPNNNDKVKSNSNALEWQDDLDANKFNVPKIPEKLGGYPLQYVTVSNCNSGPEIFTKYGNVGCKYNDNYACVMRIYRITPKNSNASVNNDLDDTGRIDGNSRGQSLLQKCCSCWFNKPDKKND